MAPHWRTEGFGHHPIDAKVIESLPRDATVLEYGPGYGDALPALQCAVGEGAVVVVDRSPDVIASLRDEYRDSIFRFVKGDRPRDERQPAASVDYMRARRIAPYLDEAGMRQLFNDADVLLRPGGALFITACHPSQTPVDSFGTQSLAQVIEISGNTRLLAGEVDVAIIARQDGIEPLEVFQLDVADATPQKLQELDQHISERRACHRGDVEVEMRFTFRANASPTRLEEQ